MRVIDHGRVGSHRTGTAEPGELESAVRLAVAQSRSREPLPGLRHIPADETPLVVPGQLYDRRLTRLGRRRSAELLGGLRRRRERLELTWHDARVAVFNSRGVRRQIEVTAAALGARCGRRPGAGRAVGAARRLRDLEPEAIVARAQARHATGTAAEPPAGPLPVVLSPEATAQLFDLLNRVAFSAVAYYEGSSFLREHLGVQVFDRAVGLRDDGTDAAGLPFPFDLEGTAKRPVELIAKGTPKTPALDQRQAAVAGLPPTAHAIAGADARALNLFVEAGELGDEELMAAADGGLWIGWLDHLECFEPGRAQIRARAGGVRRIAGGRLAAGVPDLVWEDSLLRAFSSLLGVSRETLLVPAGDGYLGAVRAPGLAISGAELVVAG